MLANRVAQTTTAVGNGAALDITGGAKTGHRTFGAGIGFATTCYYAIAHQTSGEWEVGIGTVTSGAPDVLNRTTVLDGSSGPGTRVNFSAGTKDVFNTLPASRVVSKNDADVVPGTTTFVTIAATTATVTGELHASANRFKVDTTGRVLIGTAVTTSVAAGEVVLGNLKALRGVNAAGTDSFELIKLTAADEVDVSPQAKAINLVGTTVFFNNIGTTASAANAFLDSGLANRILRSTSSRRFKTDVTELERPRSITLLKALRPKMFRSLAEADPELRHFVGFVAEEVWEIGKGTEMWEGKRYVHLDKKGRPDGIAYAQFTVPLVAGWQDHEARLSKIENALARRAA